MLGKSALRVAICAFFVFGLIACGISIDSSLKLAPTPPLSGGSGWAVVEVAYARLKARPSGSASDLGHLRRGSVVELLGRELGDPMVAKDKGLWCRLKVEGVEGFVRESELDVFSSKEQADRAARGYQ